MNMKPKPRPELKASRGFVSRRFSCSDWFKPELNCYPDSVSCLKYVI